MSRLDLRDSEAQYNFDMQIFEIRMRFRMGKTRQPWLGPLLSWLRCRGLLTKLCRARI